MDSRTVLPRGWGSSRTKQQSPHDPENDLAYEMREHAPREPQAGSRKRLPHRGQVSVHAIELVGESESQDGHEIVAGDLGLVKSLMLPRRKDIGQEVSQQEDGAVNGKPRRRQQAIGNGPPDRGIRALNRKGIRRSGCGGRIATLPRSETAARRRLGRRAGPGAGCPARPASGRGSPAVCRRSCFLV